MIYFIYSLMFSGIYSRSFGPIYVQGFWRAKTLKNFMSYHMLKTLKSFITSRRNYLVGSADRLEEYALPPQMLECFFGKRRKKVSAKTG